MAAEGSTTPEQNELSMKIDKLTNQLESVLSWIQSQSPILPRAQPTPLKDRYEGIASSKEDEDDNPNGESSVAMAGGYHRPFKVEARTDILTFDGTVNAEKLESWIDQLETYFTLYGFNSREKVAFVRLKLASYALAWWNTYLKTRSDEDVQWSEFTRPLRREFYPMGYLQD